MTAVSEMQYKQEKKISIERALFAKFIYRFLSAGLGDEKIQHENRSGTGSGEDRVA